MQREILHVDVNNAFLSWLAVYKLEQGESLDIRTIPAVIGGDEKQRHGIVLAKSNLAKQFGIKTGEPLYSARKKCPTIKIYESNFKVYKKYSDMLFELLQEYSFKIERFSIDECFIDMTEFLNNRKLIDVAYEISKRVREELKFTVNIGVAHNKLLAKMASDFQKPNRVHTLYEKEIPRKMWNLPISELFMVGRRTLPKLYNMNIKTIEDLAKTDKNLLIKKFGKFGKVMWEYANGIDDSEVNYLKQKPKGVGNSTTVSQDITNIEKIEEVLLALTEHTTYRLRKHNMLGNVVSVQLRTSDFKNYSHQRKLNFSTNSTKEIFKTAKELVRQLYNNEPIRLIGIRIDNLCDEEEKQISLFEDQNIKKQEKLDKVVDNIKDKFGYEMITRAGDMKQTKNINRKD
mgnify:CR=1 FL=1